MDKKRFVGAINIMNKRARHDYEILETLTAGMVLEGGEIKSIRGGKAHLNEAYCYFYRSSLHVKNMHIAPYEAASFRPPDPRRARKLLLHKREQNKWKGSVEEKGLTIVPLRLFLSKRGWAKLEIALVRGKKTYDKREDIKKREAKRTLDRLKKRYSGGDLS